MAKEPEANPVAAEAAQAAEAPQSAARIIWQAIHDKPGITSGEIHAAALARGVTKSSINTALAKLVNHARIVRVRGTAWSELAGKNVNTYETVGGDTYDEAKRNVAPPPPVNVGKNTAAKRAQAAKPKRGDAARAKVAANREAAAVTAIDVSALKHGAALLKLDAAPVEPPAPLREEMIPDGLPNIARVWFTLKEHPGLTSGEVADLVEPFGVPRASVPSNIVQLRNHGTLRVVGSRHGGKYRGNRESPTYATVGDSYLPPGHRPASRKKAHEGAAPVRQDANAAAPVQPYMNGAATLPAPADTVASEVAHSAGIAAAEREESGAPAEVESRKRRRVYWSQAEIEAICRKWARDHIALATPLSEKALAHIAKAEGFGYRTRDVAAQFRRDFVKEHGALLLDEVKRQREAPPVVEAPPEAPEAPPVAAQVTPPPAPEASLGELIERALRGMIREAVADQLAEQQKRLDGLLDSLIETVRAVPGARFIPRHDPTPPADPTPKPKAYRVVILNALSEQVDSVRRAFPDVDFRALRDRTPEDDADLVIGLAKFMSHPLEYACKRKFGERYIHVFGASDAIKRALTARLGPPQATNGLH